MHLPTVNIFENSKYMLFKNIPKKFKGKPKLDTILCENLFKKSE